jgi:hypothetical protein
VDVLETLCDVDRRLFQRVAAWARFTELAELDEPALRDVTASEGIDFATTLLYHRILFSQRHGPFIRRIKAMQSASRQMTDLSIAVAPGAFYREHPQTGADGKRVRAAADALGCRTYLIPTASVGSAAANGRVICDWLLRCSDERIVVCSLSKGGADVKMAFGEPDAADAFRNVVAWLNVGGIMRGSPMATWLLQRPWLALVYRWLFRFRGRDFNFVRELDRGGGGPLDCSFAPPRHMRVIHVIGFPLVRHIQNPRTRRWHRRLSSFGPNDGATLLSDTCNLPGLILPVWGADHYFDAEWNQEAIVAALLQHVSATLDRTTSTSEAAAVSRI